MENTKKTKIIPWQIGVALVAVATFNSGLMLISTFIENANVIWFLFYLCKILSLFVEVAGLGAAILYLAQKQTGNSALVLLIAAGCNGIPLLAAAIRESFVYVDIDIGGALIAYIAAAFANILISLLVHTAALLFIWAIFFRREKEPLKPQPQFRARTILQRANLTGLAVLGAYQLFGLVPDTVVFIVDYWPNIYPNEVASMVFDFVFLFASLALGYLFMYLIQLLLTPEE